MQADGCRLWGLSRHSGLGAGRGGSCSARRTDQRVQRTEHDKGIPGPLQGGVSPAVARAAIKAAGGTIVRENTAVDLATVRTSVADFKLAAERQKAIAGVAGNRPIGVTPKGGGAKIKRDAAQLA